MIPLDYLVLRVVRRHLPWRLFRFALLHEFHLQPGLETREPKAAVDRYARLLAEAGQGFDQREILILGYGGSPGTGLELLARGAKRVVLLDPYVPPDRRSASQLAQAYPQLAMSSGETFSLDPARTQFVHASLQAYLEQGGAQVDIVLSSSVLEHVRDLGELVPFLAEVTRSDGCQLHVIDLRDHFLKYPFEMYCHTDEVWRRFFDPPSHLNRQRAWEYEALFKTEFSRVRWQAVEQDLLAFRKASARIRPSFLSGDERVDSVTRIALHAAGPRI